MTAEDWIIFLVCLHIFTMYSWHRHVAMLCKEIKYLEETNDMLREENEAYDCQAVDRLLEISRLSVEIEVLKEQIHEARIKNGLGPNFMR